MQGDLLARAAELSHTGEGGGGRGEGAFEHQIRTATPPPGPSPDPEQRRGHEGGVDRKALRQDGYRKEVKESRSHTPVTLLRRVGGYLLCIIGVWGGGPNGIFHPCL